MSAARKLEPAFGDGPPPEREASVLDLVCRGVGRHGVVLVDAHGRTSFRLVPCEAFLRGDAS